MLEENDESRKKIHKIIDAESKEKIKGQKESTSIKKTSVPEYYPISEPKNKKMKNNVPMNNIDDMIEYSCEYCNHQCSDSKSLDIHVYKKHSSWGIKM